MKKIYSGKSCSLYGVQETGFAQNQIGWESERVCERPVSVVCEEKIEDIYEELLFSIKKGDCIFYEYLEDETYQSFLRDELSERIREFGLINFKADPRFKLYFSKLLEG